MDVPAQLTTSLSQIDETYDRLQARFASHATLSLDYRLYNLKQLAYLIQDNEPAIVEAIRQDLGKAPFVAAMEDLFIILNEIDLAVRRLSKWMKDDGRWWDATFAYKSMKPRVTKQPKGVALIISPWNYPWQCALAPLVGAIAAGCPAIIKPSDLAPASSALVAMLLPRYLDPEAYAIVLGGVKESTHLLEKPWGHILFTGSTTVGTIVATAAAKTLTPTTLELGGKSPVIISSCANVKIAAIRMLSMKSPCSGQTCVAPDYILCARDHVDDLIREFRSAASTRWPPSPSSQSFLHNHMYGSLRGLPEYERLSSLLAEAEKEGQIVIRGESDPTTKRMGISVVLLPEASKVPRIKIIEEEIFGPIIPIIPVENVDEAIRYVNSRPKPLALYVCATKQKVFKKIKEETISGSIILNDFVVHVPSRSLPFGGVGESGWGSYHGYDGFRTFTHFKSTLEVPLWMEPIMHIRYPPVTPFKQRIIRLLFSSGVAFRRPTSVENERFRRRSGRVVRAVILGAAVLLGVWYGGKKIAS
ncbi:hypothetical protein JCM24511_09062 [Saitozyma sp. JCM 24511]|nr:hypothetical protein JCM24511_09062 [Saitozyma sp. JCM 24511]